MPRLLGVATWKALFEDTVGPLPLELDRLGFFMAYLCFCQRPSERAAAYCDGPRLLLFSCYNPLGGVERRGRLALSLPFSLRGSDGRIAIRCFIQRGQAITAQPTSQASARLSARLRITGHPGKMPSNR